MAFKDLYKYYFKKTCVYTHRSSSLWFPSCCCDRTSLPKSNMREESILLTYPGHSHRRNSGQESKQEQKQKLQGNLPC